MPDEERLRAAVLLCAVAAIVPAESRAHGALLLRLERLSKLERLRRIEVREPGRRLCAQRSP